MPGRLPKGVRPPAVRPACRGRELPYGPAQETPPCHSGQEKSKSMDKRFKVAVFAIASATTGTGRALRRTSPSASAG